MACEKEPVVLVIFNQIRFLSIVFEVLKKRFTPLLIRMSLVKITLFVPVPSTKKPCPTWTTFVLVTGFTCILAMPLSPLVV